LQVRVDPSLYSYPALYSLEASRDLVVEGESFEIYLYTANVSNGTTVAYTITGVSTADINGASLTGNFTVTDNFASFTITVTADILDEDLETLTLTLDSTGDFVSVALLDPVFVLSSDKEMVNEGQSFTVSLATLGVSDGTLIPYTITGVTSDDIDGASLTGSFVMENDTSSIIFTTSVNPELEGEETFVLTLDNGFSSVSVDITEPTFTLSSNKADCDEGSTFSIELNTTDIINSTEVAYTITGVSSADISGASLSGVFTIIDDSASITFTVSNDRTTEGSETFTLSLDNGEDSINVIINDTSLTPTYSLATSAATINEGQSVTITLTTTNVDPGELVPYTITGTGITAGELELASLTGNFTVAGTYSSGSASLVINVSADVTTEGVEVLTLTLDDIGVGVTVTINDTSRTPGYSIGMPASVNEGESFNVTLSTENVANGTTIPYTISGVTSADINGRALTGNFVVNNDSASFNVITTADATTEGDESMTVTCSTLPGSPSATTIIRDTSRTPIYTLSRSTSAVNEGSQFIIYLDTQNVNVPATVNYTITGVASADISNASLTGSFNVTGNYSSGSASQAFTATADYATEGTETFTLTLTGITSPPSISVTINDTTTFGTLAFTKLDPQSGSGNFGYSMDASPNYFVVGDNLDGRSTYIFRMSDGQQLHQLANPRFAGSGVSTSWGWSVACTDTYTVVGAPAERPLGPGSPANVGLARYFSTANGSVVGNQYVNPYQTLGGEQNGYAVAMRGAYSIFTTPGEFSFNQNNGTWESAGGWAHLRNATGVSLASAMNPNTKASAMSDRFGQNVAINDSGVAAIWAYDEQPAATTTPRGICHVYTYNAGAGTFTRARSIEPADNSGFSRPGMGGVWQLAINSQYIAIGNRSHKGTTKTTSYEGAAYIYRISDGALIRTHLSNEDGDGSDQARTGASVALNSTYVAVGSTYSARTVNGTVLVRAGKVQLFRLSDGVLVRTFVDPTNQAFATFGSNIAMTENRLLIRSFSGADSKWTVHVFGIS
jgi:hypothetical protein